MMIFKKAIPRRTFLRGAGVTIGLPLLDGMFPALAAPSDAVKSPARLSIVYVPNGIIMEKWTPSEVGTAFKMPPILEPMAPYRDRMTLVTGLAHNEAMEIEKAEAGGDHSRGFSSYLTGVRVNPTMGKDLRAGVSLDQIAAQELGKQTQLTSLEVSVATQEAVGQCEPNYSCAYVDTLSWRTPTTPLPMETNPRAVFERLFGDSDTTSAVARRARLEERRSILDWVTKDLTQFMPTLNASDRAKLTEYLDSIREIERRIQLAEKQSAQELPTLDRPSGIPTSYEDYVKLMVDLQVLAMQCDLTRVTTFLLGREGPFGSRPYPEIGISDLHHTLSHHRLEPAKIELLSQINRFHVKNLAYFVERLRSTPDGDGSLLDHSLLMYGSDMGDGNSHQHSNLPVLLVGGAGQMKGGRHLRYPDRTPMTNLYVAMLDKLGIPVERFGDSTGKLELLAV